MSQTDPKRKRLCEMTPEERRMWSEEAHARLSSFSSYVQRYLNRRSARGQRTSTDEQYNQFQELAADLLAALAEIQEEAAQEEGLQ